MKRKLTLVVITLLLTFGLSSIAAYADSITFTLSDPAQRVSGQSGGTLTFVATVSAPGSNSGDVWLNGVDHNVAVPLTVDDTNFFLNFPFFLSPGDSFTGDLFTVTVPPGTLAGDYFGIFTLLGGVDGSAQDVLGTVNFTMTVTPEPSSFLLLGTGMVGAFGALKRKRFFQR